MFLNPKENNYTYCLRMMVIYAFTYSPTKNKVRHINTVTQQYDITQCHRTDFTLHMAVSTFVPC